MHIPLATYRIQFSSEFDFKAGEGILPYLSELGISHIYSSPIFQARKGSTHGYDVVDPNMINPELGGEPGFDNLAEKRKGYGLEWIQDIVPNHMAFDTKNPAIADLMENGEASQYYNFFDILWDHPYESMRGRVLAPFLGRSFGECLEAGEIKLTYGADGFRITYYDMAFPLRLESYANILTLQLARFKEKMGRDHPDLIKLLGIIYVVKSLPSAESSRDRYDQIIFIKRLLWELYTRNSVMKELIDETVAVFNGKKGDPASFQLLDQLHAEQIFRLSFWKVATEELNYRRFFSVNDLISVRVEDESVFDYMHGSLFRLLKEKKIDALRADHIDGLYDPYSYLDRLREKTGDIYIIVEKILDSEEMLPPFWPVQGTSGYDFMNQVNSLFCMRRNERILNRIYGAFTDHRTSYRRIVYEKKKLILEKDMAGDVDNLAYLLRSLSAADRYARDFTHQGLSKALAEVLASFPVYRTYVNEETLTEIDLAYIKEAVGRAEGRNPALSNVFPFIQRFLLLQYYDYLTPEEKQQWVHFVKRFQQMTGPLTAKGFEDTTLYVYNRLISLNEVGGSPERFGGSRKDFHTFILRRAEHWPHSINATATHDTKRGEDVRARINVLSEVPAEWENRLRSWGRMNRAKKERVNDLDAPDRNDEYFLYQTLIGTYPFDQGDHAGFVDRIKDYAIKAVREAKVHTAWLKPDTAYEDAYILFIERLLDPKENPFLEEFLSFQKRIAHYGVINSLSQTLIKMTAPGVPDFYQGSELWDLTLVDPDNRRPVDFEGRRSMLMDMEKRAGENRLSLISDLLSEKGDGRIKLFLINRILKARRRFRELFENGSYEPLQVGGRHRDKIIAYERRNQGHSAVVVAPRFLTSLVNEGDYPLGPEVWGDTHVMSVSEGVSPWEDAITGESVPAGRRIRIGDILRHFPGALLVGNR